MLLLAKKAPERLEEFGPPDMEDMDCISCFSQPHHRAGARRTWVAECRRQSGWLR